MLVPGSSAFSSPVTTASSRASTLRRRARATWRRSRPRGRRGSRTQCGRSSSSGSPISSKLERAELLHPLRLPLDVVILGGAPRRQVRPREAAPPRRARRRARPRRDGSTRTPPSGGTNSGGPPTRRRHDGAAARHALRAWRGRRARRGSAGRRRRCAAIHAATRSCCTGPTTRIPGRPSSAGRRGPSPTNASPPSPRCSKARGEAAARSCAR